MRIRTLLVSLLLTGPALLSGPGCSSAPKAGAEPTVEPGTYLPDFDKSWELVRDTYHDPEHNGLDWEGVRAELRPRAEQATTRSQNRALIQEMVGRLGESHFGVIPEETERAAAGNGSGDASNGSATDDTAPPEASAGGQADPGFEFRIVDGQAVVTRVAPDSPAANAGVATGWVLAKIGASETATAVAAFEEAVGGHLAKMYAWAALGSRLQGEAGSELELTFLDAADRERPITLTRVMPQGEVVKFGNLPPVVARLEHRWLTPEETGDADARIGYIAFNIFMIPITPLFEQAMMDFKDADAIVIDLRGNIGGVAAMCAGLSRFVVTEKSRIGTMMMRGQELQFNAEPIVVTRSGQRLKPFAGPLAILIDEGTASTSEFMAGGLRGLGRATTFGSRSAGMALPAAMSRLPSGDVLLHAIADYVSSDGTRLEADGVPADREVATRRADLLRGVDAPLREAAAWAVTESRATKPDA
jgi:carboxyl-terminal processing protease